MLDGINALFSCFGAMWHCFMSLPLYGNITWGWFLIACEVMAILISFFVQRFK